MPQLGIMTAGMMLWPGPGQPPSAPAASISSKLSSWVQYMSPRGPIDTYQKPRFPNLPDPSGAGIGSGNSR